MAIKPIHHGPIPALAIMAMAALAIPLITVVNNNKAITNSSAASLNRIYTPKEPTVLYNDPNPKKPTTKPTPTVKPGTLNMKMTY